MMAAPTRGHQWKGDAMSYDEPTESQVDAAAARLMEKIQPAFDAASRAVVKEAIYYRGIVLELSIRIHERLDGLESRLAELEQGKHMTTRKPKRPMKRPPITRPSFRDRLILKGGGR